MKAQLFILGGRDVGRSFEIADEAVLGRDPRCDVQLHDRSISRKHAVVRLSGEGWLVEDLGSRNGITVRHKRVPSAPLADHDEFMLGDLPIRFRLSGANADAPAAPPPPSPAERVAEPVPPVRGRRDQREELGEEIELEEEIRLEDEPGEALADTVTRARPHAPPGAPARAPVSLEPAPEAARPALSEHERRRAEILGAQRRTGLLRGDLSQQPLWVRGLIGIAVTAMVLGLTFLAYRLMQTLRGSL